MRMTKTQIKELTLEQIQANPFLLKDIENPTEEQQLMAIRTDGQTLSLFVENQTEYLAYEAVRQNPAAIAFSNEHSPRILLEVAKRQDIEGLSFLISKLLRSQGAFEAMEEVGMTTLLNLHQNEILIPQLLPPSLLDPLPLDLCWMNLFQGWTQDNLKVESFFSETLPEPFLDLLEKVKTNLQMSWAQTNLEWVAATDSSDAHFVLERPHRTFSLSLAECIEYYPLHLAMIPLHDRSYRLCRYAKRQEELAVWMSPYHVLDALLEQLPSEVYESYPFSQPEEI